MPAEAQFVGLLELRSWCTWARYLRSLEVLPVEERLALLRCFHGAGFDSGEVQGASAEELLGELSGDGWYYKLATELATPYKSANSFDLYRFYLLVRSHLMHKYN